MEVVGKGVGVVGTQIGTQSPDCQVHNGHFPGVGIGFLTVNGNGVSFAGMVGDEPGRLDKHSSGTATGVIDPGIAVGFQDGHKGVDNAGGGVELSAAFAFFFGKLGNAVFVSAAQKIAVAFGFAHVHVGKKINDVSQNLFVQVGAGVIFGQHAFESFVVGFDSPHGVVDDDADFRFVGGGSDFCPAGGFRYKENVFFKIGIGVIFKTVAFQNKLIVFFLESGGNVFQENQSDDDVAVFGSGDMPPKDTGGILDLFFKTDVGSVVGFPGSRLCFFCHELNSLLDFYYDTNKCFFVVFLVIQGDGF